MTRLVTGGAFLALWNGVTPSERQAYEAWHSKDHVPERLTVPGMIAAHRFEASDGDPFFFTLYDVYDASVFHHPAYRRLIDEPSPSSVAMRPFLDRFRRLVCDPIAGTGTEVQAFCATVDANASQALPDALIGRPRDDGGQHPLSAKAFIPDRIAVATGQAPPTGAGASVFRFIETIRPVR